MAKISLKYRKEKGENAKLTLEIFFSSEELRLNPVFEEIPISSRDGVIIEIADYRGNRRCDSIEIKPELNQVFIFTFEKVPAKENIEKLVKLVEDEVKRGLEEAKKKQEIVEKWEREVIL